MENTHAAVTSVERRYWILSTIASLVFTSIKTHGRNETKLLEENESSTTNVEDFL